jgi:hypothetical protein
MHKTSFDISQSRFKLLWLIIGLVIGRAVGLIACMNFYQWYFVKTTPLVMWQIFMAVVCAIFYSFLMTSKERLPMKYGLLGLGAGFAFGVYSGEIWSMVQPDRSPAWLTGMLTAEGIFYEWYFTHLAWAGGVAGMITGIVITRKKSRVKQDKHDNPEISPESPEPITQPESGVSESEIEQG